MDDGPNCFTLKRHKDKKETGMKVLNKHCDGNKRGQRNNWNRENPQLRNNPREGVNERDNAMAALTVNEDMILMAKVQGKKISDNTWIANSGSSSHISNSLEGMYKLKDNNTQIKVGRQALRVSVFISRNLCWIDILHQHVVVLGEE